MNSNNHHQHNLNSFQTIFSLFKIKSLLLFLSLILIIFLQNSSQAIWLSKDQFMQQYSTKFVNGFPDDNLSRRTVMQHWCNAVTDNSITINKKKTTIDWFVYASGTYTSPNQSTLAYIICAPFLDGWTIKDRFNKKLISAIKTTKREQINPILDTKACPINTQANNLNDCDLMDTIHKITLITFNDLTNIRQGTSRWYLSLNEEDLGYFVAQHFAYGSGKTMIKRIENINNILCENSNIPYFEDSKNSVPRCWFPSTYNIIKTNRTQFWKEIIKKTTAINGERLLQYECDNINNGINLLWCGINDHSSTQAYNSMIYNELRFYEQFLAMYESTASLSTSFLVGNKVGLWTNWQSQLLNHIRILRQAQLRRIYNAAQNSTNLIGQFESAYPLHIWLLAAHEASNSAVNKYIKPRQASIKFWMIDRLNTQKKDDTSKSE